MLLEQEHGVINAFPLLFDPAEGCWLFSLDQTPLSDTRPGGNWILTLVRAESPQVLAQAHSFPQLASLLSANLTRWATTVCWAPWNVPLMGHLALPLPWHLHTRVCLPRVCPAVCSCTGTARVLRAPFTPEGKSTPVGVDSPSLPKYFPEAAPRLSDFDKEARHPLIFYTFYFFKENVAYQNHSKQN